MTPPNPMGSDGKDTSKPPAPAPVTPGPPPSLASKDKKTLPSPTTETNPMGANGTAVSVNIGNAPTISTPPAPASTGENHNPTHSTA